MATARQGFQSHGVELNWWLVLYSRLVADRSGLRRTATFARQDLWKANLKPYGNVVIFGVEEMVSAIDIMDPRVIFNQSSIQQYVTGAKVLIAYCKSKNFFRLGLNWTYEYRNTLTLKLLGSGPFSIRQTQKTLFSLGSLKLA